MKTCTTVSHPKSGQGQDGVEPYALNVARRILIPLEPKVKEQLDLVKAAGVIELSR